MPSLAGGANAWVLVLCGSDDAPLRVTVAEGVQDARGSGQSLTVAFTDKTSWPRARNSRTTTPATFSLARMRIADRDQLGRA